MREALLKTRCGIPAALLILFVSAGVATAFVVENFTFTANAQEPLSFEKKDGLDIKYQGESDNIIVHVQNLSPDQGYGIFVNAAVKGACSITYSCNLTDTWVSTEQDQNEDVNGDGDMWDARYNIYAGFTYDIVVTVDSADNVAPGDLKVVLEFHRKAAY